ncbi:hypothetical protein [Candidatus Similichlamydia laticola]|uniref:Uncharacterized protein n=1 Tax=Candidatus Similichlamydia laticola TaxID=2170265 RepID=A0A369KKA1_9BACT|nr:hypothetical protein [Candidatus Similichlamydia laticola]RDB31426.1 hypothetical protein HAT2_00469 [Candidatus Similichlamydia laticola]
MQENMCSQPKRRMPLRLEQDNIRPSLQQKEEDWFVFVTCSDGPDGNLCINMSSYGDPKVLAFMLEGAQERLWEEEGESQG